MTIRSQGRNGVLPSHRLVQAISDGIISGMSEDDALAGLQPASLDLHLGDTAYRLRCSFLPNKLTVDENLKRHAMGEVPLSENGAILERNRPYLIPLAEHLHLPPGMRAKANPKSSTGRLDIFTRLVTDRSHMFDEIPADYDGRLYLEVVSRTFTIRVRRGLALNQLRLSLGTARLSDTEIHELHATLPLLFEDGSPVARDRISANNGLFVSLGLGGKNGGKDVGFRAKANSHLLDVSRIGAYQPSLFWETVQNEAGGLVVLNPEEFYLLLSRESIRIPPSYASEMTAYDPTSGELRTHYAGFFDPGFGHGEDVAAGSKAALEIRAHDVPFAVQHGQNICRLSFERMLEPPEVLYGAGINSNYQGQETPLSKHFKRAPSKLAQDTLY